MAEPMLPSTEALTRAIRRAPDGLVLDEETFRGFEASFAAALQGADWKRASRDFFSVVGFLTAELNDAGFAERLIARVEPLLARHLPRLEAEAGERADQSRARFEKLVGSAAAAPGAGAWPEPGEGLRALLPKGTIKG